MAASEDEIGFDTSGSGESDDDFTEISRYFDENRFSEFSLVEKRMYRTQKRRYEASRIEREW